MAFFLARAIQGGSSWLRAGEGTPRWAAGVGLEPADCAGVVLDEKGGDVSVMLPVGREGAGLEVDSGLMQEGGLWPTGTGVGGDRDR